MSKLQVVIRDCDGHTVDIVDLPDPRDVFVKQYNTCPAHQELGLHAELLDSDYDSTLFAPNETKRR